MNLYQLISNNPNMNLYQTIANMSSYASTANLTATNLTISNLMSASIIQYQNPNTFYTGGNNQIYFGMHNTDDITYGHMSLSTRYYKVNVGEVLLPLTFHSSGVRISNDTNAPSSINMLEVAGNMTISGTINTINLSNLSNISSNIQAQINSINNLINSYETVANFNTTIANYQLISGMPNMNLYYTKTQTDDIGNILHGAINQVNTSLTGQINSINTNFPNMALYELKTDLNTLISFYYTKTQTDNIGNILQGAINQVNTSLTHQINAINTNFNNYSSTTINNSLYQQ